MSELSKWNDVRRIVDELEVKMHLAAMDVRDRWRAFQPRLAHLEQVVAVQGKRIGQALDADVADPPIKAETVPPDEQC